MAESQLRGTRPANLGPVQLLERRWTEAWTSVRVCRPESSLVSRRNSVLLIIVSYHVCHPALLPSPGATGGSSDCLAPPGRVGRCFLPSSNSLKE